MLTITPARDRRVSIPALRWAARETATLPPHLAAVLIGVAACTDRHGRGARVSSRELARSTGKSRRQVERDLFRLRQLGLLRRGDPGQAPKRDGGPVVYELGMTRRTR